MKLKEAIASKDCKAEGRNPARANEEFRHLVD